MDSGELFNELASYFPKTSDLMRHLQINACWEYVITEHSTNDMEIKLNYFLYKKDENRLEISLKSPGIKPDLTLYFTEKALLNLIQGHPSADEYYARYREVMNHPKPEIEVDNKVNKPRLLLWKMGYKNWQKDFKF